MLCLAFAPGEYMMIGDSVVVQMEKITGDRCRLAVHAPKDVPIVRGTVLERTGGERPECVLEGDCLESKQSPGSGRHAGAAVRNGQRGRQRKDPPAAAEPHLPT